MTTLLESVTCLLGESEGYERLGGAIGGDAAAASSATDIAVPVIIGGIADRAARRGGPDAVLKLLVDDRAPEPAAESAVDRLNAYLAGGTPSGSTGSSASSSGGSRFGDAVLDEIFGIERDELIIDLAVRADVGRAVVSRALPVLAPMVLGEVRRLQTTDDLDGEAIAELLAAEKRNLDQRGLLGGDSDGDGDGSVLADEVSVDATVGSIDGTFDGEGSGISWLWWAIGSTVIVLVMAWLLSMCAPQADGTLGTGSVELQAGADGAATGGNDVATEADGTAGDAGSDSAGGGRARGVAAGSMPGASLGEEELDDRLDEALGSDRPSSAGRISRVDEESDTSGGSDNAGQAVDGVDASQDGDPADVVDGGQAPTAGEVVAAGSKLNDLLALDSVTFAVSSDVITAEGAAVITVVADYLAANPAINIEIGGHTDSDGAEAANLDLSQRRADSVAEFLRQAGIAGGRLQAVGYGETMPLVTNDSSAAKARNRRIEFVVV